jgi:hypothetical protein
MGMTDAAAISRAYHDAWTAGDFAGAAALPAGFGSMVTKVDLLSAMSAGGTRCPPAG